MSGGDVLELHGGGDAALFGEPFRSVDLADADVLADLVVDREVVAARQPVMGSACRPASDLAELAQADPFVVEKCGHVGVSCDSSYPSGERSYDLQHHPVTALLAEASRALRVG